MPQNPPASQGIANDPLLRPFTLKHLTFRNRIMSTSHACGLAEGGMPAERYQRYHEAKAKGGIALTMFGGSSNVSPDSQWNFPQINLHDERIVGHFEQFSKRIHAHGTYLMCQITHVGGRGEPYAGARLPPIGPSPLRETLHRAFAREMDEHDVERVVADYARAAVRCREGGLDGIETLTGAHLIGQFLSPATNRRTDRFGGSVENRCRFGLMVHEAIRKAVGDDFIVGIRFVVDEAGEHRLDFEECLEIARIFQASGTIDFFNAIYGRMDTQIKLAVDCMPGMASPMAPFLARAGAFKRAVHLPVFHATRITELATARYAIREGLLDMVAMTRAHIADPELGREARAWRGGAGAPVRRRHPLHERAATDVSPQPVDRPRARASPRGRAGGGEAARARRRRRPGRARGGAGLRGARPRSEPPGSLGSTRRTGAPRRAGELAPRSRRHRGLAEPGAGTARGRRALPRVRRARRGR